MIKKLQHIFALSEKGARDLVKAVIWCFVCNLALMFPVGAVLQKRPGERTERERCRTFVL